MKKLVYFPFPTKKGYGNPYSQNYKESLIPYFDVLDMEHRNHALQSLSLLKRSLIGDVFVFNWLENVGFWTLGKLQFVIVLLALSIIRFRKTKIIWMLHNIHPHQGENAISRYMQNWLYKNSSVIISHSRDAVAVAEVNAKSEVVYKCHPVKKIQDDANFKVVKPFDILIWGQIHPYKGVVEFLESRFVQENCIKIKIIGRCDNLALSKKISFLCQENIEFENRKIEFSELQNYMRACKIVLFPYIGDCVSSSGALMDTIVLGGKPVGPRMGAFKDLSEEGVCQTYCGYDDLKEILFQRGKENNDFEKKRDLFIRNNLWELFGQNICKLIN